jgi:hypothetical protein
MKMKISKNVSNGCLVRKHGDKWVKADNRRKPMGVYQDEQRTTLFTENGFQEIVMSKGVVIRGYALATVDTSNYPEIKKTKIRLTV